MLSQARKAEGVSRRRAVLVCQPPRRCAEICPRVVIPVGEGGGVRELTPLLQDLWETVSALIGFNSCRQTVGGVYCLGNIGTI
jgi:hypothetical protein